nr:cytochrome p450 82c2 [Quercus suber]
MYVSGIPAVLDLVQFLEGLESFLGQVKYIKRIGRELDTLVGSWVEEHTMRRAKSEQIDKPNFIDVMLSIIEDDSMFDHTRETIIKATLLNLILGGSESTSLNLTCLLSILLNNKQTLNQAQEELDPKVGRERWVDDHDIKDLIYLQTIVKETLHSYPPAPLSIPHEAMEDCHVDSDKIFPERFLTKHENANIDVSRQHFEFVPFRSGRRSCLGYTFGLQVSHLTLARLLQGFEFKTPLNMPVDMTEGLSITLPKATHLEVLLNPRLASELYQ